LATAFLIAYFITSPIFGIWATAFPAHASWPWVSLRGSAATAATGIMRTFGQLMIARSCVGIGEAAYATISPALLSDYFPARSAAVAFAVFLCRYSGGGRGRYLLGGLIEPA